MSACALRRWGPGTCSVKEPVTAAATELKGKLAAMQAERQRQDALFGSPTTVLIEQKENRQPSDQKVTPK